jgi:hypothetical protein
MSGFFGGVQQRGITGALVDEWRGVSGTIDAIVDGLAATD